MIGVTLNAAALRKDTKDTEMCYNPIFQLFNCRRREAAAEKGHEERDDGGASHRRGHQNFGQRVSLYFLLIGGDFSVSNNSHCYKLVNLLLFYTTTYSYNICPKYSLPQFIIYS